MTVYNTVCDLPEAVESILHQSFGDAREAPAVLAVMILNLKCDNRLGLLSVRVRGERHRINTSFLQWKLPEIMITEVLPQGAEGVGPSDAQPPAWLALGIERSA